MTEGSPMEELNCLFWLGPDPDGKESAFLASSFGQEMELPHFAMLDDLFRHAYEGDALFYISATDAHATLEDRPDGVLLSITNDEQVLISYLVDAQWAALAKDRQGFVWLFPTEEMLVEEVAAVAKADLVEAFENSQLNVFVVAIGTADGFSQAEEEPLNLE
jgi:hypothetical protein